MFINILGLYPQNACTYPRLLQLWQTKTSPDIPKCPRGIHITPGWKPLGEVAWSRSRGKMLSGPCLSVSSSSLHSQEAGREREGDKSQKRGVKWCWSKCWVKINNERTPRPMFWFKDIHCTKWVCVCVFNLKFTSSSPGISHPPETCRTSLLPWRTCLGRPHPHPNFWGLAGRRQEGREGGGTEGDTGKEKRRGMEKLRQGPPHWCEPPVQEHHHRMRVKWVQRM